MKIVFSKKHESEIRVKPIEFLGLAEIVEKTRVFFVGSSFFEKMTPRSVSQPCFLEKVNIPSFFAYIKVNIPHVEIAHTQKRTYPSFSPKSEHTHPRGMCVCAHTYIHFPSPSPWFSNNPLRILLSFPPRILWHVPHIDSSPGEGKSSPG